MRGQTLTRLTDGFEEATVVDRREIDDLAITGERVLLERPYCEDGADVDRAPVTAMGHLAAQPAPEDRLPVEDRVREDRLVYLVPAPRLHVVAERSGEPFHCRVQRL